MQWLWNLIVPLVTRLNTTPEPIELPAWLKGPRSETVYVRSGKDGADYVLFRDNISAYFPVVVPFPENREIRDALDTYVEQDEIVRVTLQPCLSPQQEDKIRKGERPSPEDMFWQVTEVAAPVYA